MSELCVDVGLYYYAALDFYQRKQGRDDGGHGMKIRCEVVLMHVCTLHLCNFHAHRALPVHGARRSGGLGQNRATTSASHCSQDVITN